MIHPRLVLFILFIFLIQGCSLLTTGLKKPEIEILNQLIEYDFEVLKIEDKTYTNIKDEDDRLIFVNFWSTYCAPCIKELPQINKLYSEEKNRCDFYIIGLDTTEKQEAFFKNKGFTFPPYYLKKTGYPVGFDSRVIPTTYLIKGNQVLLRNEGSANWNVYEIKLLIEEYGN